MPTNEFGAPVAQELLDEIAAAEGGDAPAPAADDSQQATNEFGAPVAQELLDEVLAAEADGVKAASQAQMNAEIAAEREAEAAKAPPPPKVPAKTAGKAPAKKEEGKAPKESSVAASSIRVNVDVLENLMTQVSELVLTRNQLMQLVRGRDQDDELTSPLQRLSHITSDLQEGVMKTRMQPIGNAWAKLPRIVRDLSLEQDKQIELIMVGADTELDRQVLELIKDPLTHMVRNSADHGLEMPADREEVGKPAKGVIELRAFHEGGHIIIEIEDDGRGLNMDRIRQKCLDNGIATDAELDGMSDQQIQQYIFAPGFSTAEKVTSISGRGVGMDVVRTNIEKIGGTIELKSITGKGSTFTIKIPLTLAIVSALIVECVKQRFAIPQISVLELVRASSNSDNAIEMINESPVLRLRNRLLPLVSLENLLEMNKDTGEVDEVALLEKLELERAAAEEDAAKKAAAVKAAADKQNKAAEKDVAEKAAVAKAAVERGDDLKALADKARAELAEAEKAYAAGAGGSEPAPLTLPNESQVKIVQDTFAMAEPNAEGIAEMFYNRLFELRPELQSLFSGDMNEQGKKLMSMIKTAVGSLKNLDALVPAVEVLGRRHVDYGVKDADYDTVGEALLWTLEQGFGEAFTAEVKDAWATVYTVLATVMKGAAADVGSAGPEAAVEEKRAAAEKAQKDAETALADAGKAKAASAAAEKALAGLAETEKAVAETADSVATSAKEEAGDEMFIVVTQVGTNTFGIIVDQVFDTEEIVVKPVAPILRNISFYSGNTILGDGSVIMILDPNGIATAAGQLGTDDDKEEEVKAVGQEGDVTSLLIFRAGGTDLKAVPLALIARLEEIDMATVEKAHGQNMVQYRGHLMPLIPCDSSHQFKESGRQPVLVFTEGNRSLGLVVDEIVDIVEERLKIELASDLPGLVGSAVIDGKATDLIDAGYFLTQGFADWFGSSTKDAFSGRDGLKRALLVDDSPFFRNLLSPLLSVAGWEVTTAETASEALEMREHGSDFDVIISDIEMPEMDGFEFAMEVRSDNRWKNVPMIALSGRTSEDDFRKGRDAGFNDYVAKFDREALVGGLAQTVATVMLDDIDS